MFFSSGVIQDPDLLTREVAFAKLAEFPTIPEIQTVVAQLPRIAANTNDAFLNDALTLLGRVHKVTGVGENEVKENRYTVKNLRTGDQASATQRELLDELRARRF